MTLNDLSKETNWTWLGSQNNKDITGVFIGDLLSYVMGHAQEGQVWITMQNHLNSIAVAELRDLSAIILIDSSEFDDESLKKALDHDVAVFISPHNAAESARILFKLGL